MVLCLREAAIDVSKRSAAGKIAVTQPWMRSSTAALTCRVLRTDWPESRFMTSRLTSSTKSFRGLPPESAVSCAARRYYTPGTSLPCPAGFLDFGFDTPSEEFGTQKVRCFAAGWRESRSDES